MRPPSSLPASCLHEGSFGSVQLSRISSSRVCSQSKYTVPQPAEARTSPTPSSQLQGRAYPEATQSTAAGLSEPSRFGLDDFGNWKAANLGLDLQDLYSHRYDSSDTSQAPKAATEEQAGLDHTQKSAQAAATPPQTDGEGVQQRDSSQAPNPPQQPRVEQGDEAQPLLTVQELLAVDITSISRRDKKNMEAHLTHEEKEVLRKARISAKLKGSTPWNRGGSHTEETKKLIQKKTIAAMKRPEVVKKLEDYKAAAKHARPSVATKEKISRGVAAHHALEKEAILDLLVDSSGEPVTNGLELLRDVLTRGDRRPKSLSTLASLMPPGTLAKERLTRQASSRLLFEHFPSQGSVQEIIQAAHHVLSRTEEYSSEEEDSVLTKRRAVKEAVSDTREVSGRDSQADAPVVSSSLKEVEVTKEQQENAKRQAKQKAHKEAIAEAIRRKWEDPEYRKRVVAGHGKRKEDGVKDEVSQGPVAMPARKTRVKATGEPRATSKPRAKRKDLTGSVRRGRPKKAVSDNSALLEELKQQEMVLMRKQTQRLAKLNVAKELVIELQSVLASLPSISDLGLGDVDMRQSILEAQELLVQARSRVKALEEPFQVDIKSPQPLSQVRSAEQMLQSAMMMLNMEE